VETANGIGEMKFCVTRTLLGVEGAIPNELGEMSEMQLIAHLMARRISDDLVEAQRQADEAGKKGTLALHYRDGLGTECRLDIRLI
jgi:hypothetical protein